MIRLTNAAQDKVTHLLSQADRDDLRLRLAVQPGGCSGLIYQIYFDDRVMDEDCFFDYDKFEVVVDRMSIPYLDESTLDYHDSISQQGFQLDNPNAAGSCACGDSFH